MLGSVASATTVLCTCHTQGNYRIIVAIVMISIFIVMLTGIVDAVDIAAVAVACYFLLLIYCC